MKTKNPRIAGETKVVLPCLSHGPDSPPIDFPHLGAEFPLFLQTLALDKSTLVVLWMNIIAAMLLLLLINSSSSLYRDLSGDFMSP